MKFFFFTEAQKSFKIQDFPPGVILTRKESSTVLVFLYFVEKILTV